MQRSGGLWELLGGGLPEIWRWLDVGCVRQGVSRIRPRLLAVDQSRAPASKGVSIFMALDSGCHAVFQKVIHVH